MGWCISAQSVQTDFVLPFQSCVGALFYLPVLCLEEANQDPVFFLFLWVKLCNVVFMFVVFKL